MTRHRVVGKRRWTYDDADRIDSGGFGTVYRGRADDNGGNVAVKVIPLGGPGPTTAQRHRELRIATSLGDDPGPNVIPYLDQIETTQAVVLVMPLATRNLATDVGTLDDPDIAVAILTDVLTGLATLHRLDLLHRDIKPENVLLVDRAWMLADFSLARDTTTATATHTLSTFRSPAYAAPELWLGESASTRTDLYAVGCLAFALSAGATPFTGPDFGPQHLNDRPPDLPPRFGVRYEQLVSRLLAKTPDARPSSADAALQWLTESVHAEDINSALDTVAARLDRQKAAERAQRTANQTVAVAYDDALTALHQIAAEAVAHLRRVDPAATASPTHGERGSIELTGAGGVTTITVTRLHGRTGVPRGCIAAGTIARGTAVPANLLYVADGGPLGGQWQLRRSQRITPTAPGQSWGSDPRGLELSEFLRSLVPSAARRADGSVERQTSARLLTALALLQIHATDADGWQ